MNLVTPELFRRWPTPRALAQAEPADVEEVIKSTGFFRNKAKNIKAASEAIIELHQGEVPRDREAMVALPGVARKTANVVQSACFPEMVAEVQARPSLRLSETAFLDRGSFEFPPLTEAAPATDTNSKRTKVARSLNDDASSIAMMPRASRIRVESRPSRVMLPELSTATSTIGCVPTRPIGLKSLTGW